MYNAVLSLLFVRFSSTGSEKDNVLPEEVGVVIITFSLFLTFNKDLAYKIFNRFGLNGGFPP